MEEWESFYRRGFQQGVAAVIYMLERGATIDDIDHYCSELSAWRCYFGRWAGRRGCMDNPPEWTKLGVVA